jgi:hypothetical protein
MTVFFQPQSTAGRDLLSTGTSLFMQQQKLKHDSDVMDKQEGVRNATIAKLRADAAAAESRGKYYELLADPNYQAAKMRQDGMKNWMSQQKIQSDARAEGGKHMMTRPGATPEEMDMGQAIVGGEIAFKAQGMQGNPFDNVLNAMSTMKNSGQGFASALKNKERYQTDAQDFASVAGAFDKNEGGMLDNLGAEVAETRQGLANMMMMSTNPDAGANPSAYSQGMYDWTMNMDNEVFKTFMDLDVNDGWGTTSLSELIGVKGFDGLRNLTPEYKKELMSEIQNSDLSGVRKQDFMQRLGLITGTTRAGQVLNDANALPETELDSLNSALGVN